MALFSNNFGKDGTHTISGGGGRDYPFGRPQHNSSTLAFHLHLDASGNPERLLSGSNNTYKMHGKAEFTMLGTLVVYLNGFPLSPNEYTVNEREGLITIHRHIKPIDDDLEVRSKDSEFTIVEHILILEVIDGVIAKEDLSEYLPSVGDKLNLKRIMSIKENAENAAFDQLNDAQEDAFVLPHYIKDNGIYARLRVRW